VYGVADDGGEGKGGMWVVGGWWCGWEGCGCGVRGVGLYSLSSLVGGKGGISTFFPF